MGSILLGRSDGSQYPEPEIGRHTPHHCPATHTVRFLRSAFVPRLPFSIQAVAHEVARPAMVPHSGCEARKDRES